ncbi:TetR/AcrR family transcriptional regulator [Shewanella canadensis]|uniref:TetR/AcrR family transcriptional regulator n=1 Tax=Shewanella canadensis TaxID=271096 RepID=A0A3S0IU04_9GAMM|nr:TetR/AcrR family transcriptional regulator [Shewanella canadensis]RTR39693.1 TetR/AcrR family transcriptional regulator [Shewanella canadensis]
MLREQIAASLEEAFSKYGFAEPSVAQLKTACNVSLRTLYKYYPSKEAMIVGALEYRHQRYLTFLLNESPSNGVESVLHIFNKLEQWMKEYAPHGCLSMNAIAAFPDNPLISKAVKEHKEQVRQFLGLQSQREDLSTALFLLHEGVSSAWPLLGKEAVTSAQKAILQLLEEDL